MEEREKAQPVRPDLEALESKVAEQAAELRRGEAFLAQVQRLTQTGSFAIDVRSREVTYASAELLRLCGFDPALGIPPVAEFVERVHADDRPMCAEALAEGIRGRTEIEVEYRVQVPGRPPRIHRALAQPVLDASGEPIEFVGTIIDITGRRATGLEMARLVSEQAALRRVAIRVAGEAPEADVFTTIAEEIGRLVGAERMRMMRFEGDRSALVVGSCGPTAGGLRIGARVSLEDDSATARVFHTGRPARIDDYGPVGGPVADQARSTGVRSVVAAPILVEGRLWGAMAAATLRGEPLPPESEARLLQFSELMATTIASTEARARADRLAEEQASLRRVATLVAKEAPPQEVFGKVAEEVAYALGDVEVSLFRDEGDGTATVVAMYGNLAEVGTRMSTDGDGVIATVLREGRPHRSDDNRHSSGTIVEEGRRLGISSAIGSPILVGGRVWGALGAARTHREPFAPGVERQLAQFAELAATAIANAKARAEVEQLADEQAALHRVATLVAHGVEPAELFAAVSREVGRMFGSDLATVGRWDPDGPFHLIVGLIRPMAGLDVGSRMPLSETTAVAAVYRTGRSARTDAPSPLSTAAREMSVVSGVSSPVVVEGRPWGAISVAAKEALPPDAERRLEKFTELVATAVANAESREALGRLADEQAALRRVATLVARGASPATVFDTVAAEMAALLQSDGGLTMCRYEEDGELTVVAHRGAQEPELRPGSRFRHDDPHSVTATVRRTGLPARQDSYADTHGSIGEVIERLRFRSGVGVPIIVDGRVWGVTVANWMSEQPPPPETEQRMAQFGELLDTAIANADIRDQLTASRARLLTAADEARRRVVRDLHDGAQQRLVHGIVSLKLVRRALPDDGGELRSLVDEALDHVERSNAELRELAHGILPAILTHRGLRAAIETVVARLDIPVSLDVTDERFPAEVEASGYFTVAEALTNVLKHAHATHADVTTTVTDAVLRIEVRDDGIGGADPHGTGLLGLQDRAAALGGTLAIESPAGGGTVLAATLPVAPA